MTTKKKSPSNATKKVVVREKAKEEAPIYVSDEDRLGNLETAMTGIAQTMERLETRFTEQGKLSIAKSPEARVEAMRGATLDKLGQSTRVQDLLHPRAQDSGFQQNDIVRLADDCPKACHYMADADGFPAKPDEDGKPTLGVVMSYMYTKRNGQRKYKVNFPNFGKDGFTEKELVLVKPA